MALLIVHSHSESTMLDTVVSSSVTLLSHCSLSTRKSVLVPRIAFLLSAAQIQAGGLSSRVAQVSAKRVRPFLFMQTHFLHFMNVVHLHFWRVTMSPSELQHLCSCPDTLPSTQHVPRLRNGRCVALCSSRSATDGFLVNSRSLIFCP